MSTVAILLCNYNHAKYLPDSLGHIVGQTRMADQIVIVDDGSSDQSWAIIQAFARRHPEIEAYANGRNLGLQSSISRALAATRCDYVVWAASDDRLLPNFLARNMAVLAEHPAAALSFSEVVVLKGDTEEIDRFAANPALRHIFDLGDLPKYLSPSDLRRRMKRGYLPIASNTAVIRLDRLKEFGGFPSPLQWFADSFACTALAMRHGVCAIAEPLALIRALPESYSQTMHERGKQLDVLREVIGLLSRRELSDVRRFMRECPSNLSVYGNLLLKILAERPRDWDLFLSYAAWIAREYKRGYGKTWAYRLAEIATRLPSRTRQKA